MDRSDTVVHIKLLTKELENKVDELRELGYNVPKLVRNFLLSFPVPTKKES